MLAKTVNNNAIMIFEEIMLLELLHKLVLQHDVVVIVVVPDTTVPTEQLLIHMELVPLAKGEAIV